MAAGPPPVGLGRADAAGLAAAVIGPLALYAATLPRTVVLEDDGLFLMAGVHLGVAHPPGYPANDRPTPSLPTPTSTPAPLSADSVSRRDGVR